MIKKAIAAALALGVTLAGVGVVAAAETGGRAPGGAIREKLEQVKTLHEQGQELRQQIGEQAEANRALWDEIRTGEGKADWAELKEESHALRAEFQNDAEVQALIDEMKARVAELRETQDPEVRQALREEILALKGDLRVLTADYAAEKEALQAEGAALKAEWEAMKEALAPVHALRDQVRGLVTEMKELREQHQSARADFRAALGDRDEAAALAALDRMIALEQQGLAKAEQLLGLLAEIETTLLAYTGQ